MNLELVLSWTGLRHLSSVLVGTWSSQLLLLSPQNLSALLIHGVLLQGELPVPDPLAGDLLDVLVLASFLMGRWRLDEDLLMVEKLLLWLLLLGILLK